MIEEIRKKFKDSETRFKSSYSLKTIREEIKKIDHTTKSGDMMEFMSKLPKKVIAIYNESKDMEWRKKMMNFFVTDEFEKMDIDEKISNMMGMKSDVVIEIDNELKIIISDDFNEVENEQDYLKFINSLALDCCSRLNLLYKYKNKEYMPMEMWNEEKQIAMTNIENNDKYIYDLYNMPSFNMEALKNLSDHHLFTLFKYRKLVQRINPMFIQEYAQKAYDFNYRSNPLLLSNDEFNPFSPIFEISIKFEEPTTFYYACDVAKIEEIFKRKKIGNNYICLYDKLSNALYQGNVLFEIKSNKIPNIHLDPDVYNDYNAEQPNRQYLGTASYFKNIDNLVMVSSPYKIAEALMDEMYRKDDSIRERIEFELSDFNTQDVSKEDSIFEIPMSYILENIDKEIFKGKY